MKSQIKLLKHQADFLEAQEKFALLLGGIGSGKSFAGSWFTIFESINEPDIPGLITANTYRQLQNATLETLFIECEKAGVRYKYNANRGILLLEKCKWFTYSLDNFDVMRGIEVGKFWGDEMRDASREAFLVMMGRLRKGKKLKGRLTTSPSGFDYLYDYFNGDKKTNEFRLIKATSHDNPHLPDSYVQTLENSYDEKVYQQEVMGEFVNITTGRIYYAFNRTRHVSNAVVKNDNYPIYIGMDFNVNPMSAVVANVIGDTVYIFDEISLPNSNTPEMADEIRLKYGNRLTIIPDSTGKALKTSGFGQSDHDILRSKGFVIKSSGNPFRMDRYNTVNNLLNKDRIKISSKCVKLIKDLEQVGYKEGTTLADDSDSSLTHISDALGYLCWYSFPILPVKNSVSMLNR